MLRRVLQTGLVSFLLVSCNFSSSARPTATPTVPPTGTATQTLIPTLTPTSTSVQLSLRVTKELVNCRSGPGLVYNLINELKEGQSARVVGRNENSSWWYVRDPGNPNGHCWVSAEVTEVGGNTDELPVILPPGVSITDVSLVVEPQRMVVDCSNFPQTFFFEAQITSNGPLIALWKWEASTGAASETGTLVFEEAGIKVLNQFYQVASANDYWVRLHIISPNEVTEQVDFRVSCSP